MQLSDGATRELTWNERARWGRCPVCGATHGNACDSSVGIPLGRNARGEVPEDGVHLARLQGAPNVIKEVAVS